MCIRREVGAKMGILPGTAKSKRGKSNPDFRINATMKLPKQQSTCIPMPLDFAIAARSSMGSTTPWGYCGHDANMHIVLESMALRMAETSARRVYVPRES